MSPGGAPTAWIVTVGDELLSGLVVDTNQAWLAAELTSMGVDVSGASTVGDRAPAITRSLRDALEHAELVVLTGGLGPTSDDRTRDAVADALGRGLGESAEVVEVLEARFRRRGFDRMPETNRRQALVLEGAALLENPAGTAPGQVLRVGRSLVALLPGVPGEMRAVTRGALRGWVETTWAERLRAPSVLEVRTTGIAESELADRVERHLGDAGPSGDDHQDVEIAFLPSLHGVVVRFVLRAGDQAQGRLEALARRLAPAWAGHTYVSASGDLAEAVLDRLRAAGVWLALAESCTGGLVAKRLTDVPGASDVIVGGVVAYADRVKRDLLGVSRDELDRHGAVSREVAVAMARGARHVFGCEAAVSVTGVAGPGGGSEEKPVGLVWMCADVGGRLEAVAETFPGDRRAVRERAAQAALMLLHRALDGAAAASAAGG